MKGPLRRLVGWIRRGPARRRRAHRLSQACWRTCDDSFLAGDDYYRAVEAALTRSILPRLQPGSRVLDVGCGSGRFTLLFARACAEGRVHGLDLSSALVEQARASAEREALHHVAFAVRDCLEPGALQGEHDWVVCMGVTATVIDDAAFAGLLRAAAACVNASGHLLLRESLSTTGAPISLARPDYRARYRTLDAFVDVLAPLGLQLEERTTLMTWEDEGTVNELLLFCRASA